MWYIRKARRRIYKRKLWGFEMETFEPEKTQLTILSLLKAIAQEQDPKRLEVLQQSLDEKRIELARHLSGRS